MGEFVIASGDAPEVFHATEQPFNEIAVRYRANYGSNPLTAANNLTTGDTRLTPVSQQKTRHAGGSVRGRRHTKKPRRSGSEGVGVNAYGLSGAASALRDLDPVLSLRCLYCQGQPKFPQLCQLNCPHAVQELVDSSARTRSACS